MSRNILSILFVGLGLSMVACGVAQDDGPLGAGLSGKGDGKASAIVVTEDKNGQTIQAAIGDTVEVWLAGNPTTGYQWELLANNRSLPLQDSGYVPEAPELTGSGGHYYFVFKPDMFAQGGSFKLELAYARSWEPAPIKTFSFTLQVAPTCMPVMCALYCDNGFQTDDNGCEICACATPDETLVTEQMNGQTIQAEVGDTIKVQLPGNPTTGYQWELLTHSRSLPLQDSGYVADEPQLTGSGGHYYFVFKPDMFAQGGSFKLELAYARSWEPAPIKTFSFTLQVAAACMPVMCELYCENGFMTNDKGCEICACK